MNYPRVIKFGYDEFVTKDRTVSARCKFCSGKCVISDRVGTTWNFVKHLERKHAGSLYLARCYSIVSLFKRKLTVLTMLWT